MPNNDTTTKFKVDISELKASMQEAKRQVAIANSEFKAVSSSMDDWAHSSDGISAKLKQLDSNLKNQKTILSNLERQYELTVQEMGEGSKAADDLKVKINNQKAVINNTEKEISNYESSLKQVNEAEKQAAKSGKTVAEVLDNVEQEAKDAGDGFTVMKGAIANFAGNILSGMVSGIKDAASNIMGLADETREYRTELGKLETAFTTAGHSTDAATKTYKDLYAVLGDEGQTVEASNMLAKLCDSEKELAEWTNIATGVYGTFGSSLPIENLAEAANETAKTGALTGGLADALNWAGVNEESFQESLDKCSTEQERQKLITETLNGLYSEAAQKYEETNKSVMDANRANSDYTDTLATMGEKIEPVTTTLKEGFNELLQKLLELVGDVDMEAFTSKIEEGFKVLKDDVLPAIKDGLQWIIDNKDIVIAGLAGIAAGFVAFNVASMIMSVVNAFKAFKLANEGATVAQWLLNVAMNANPIMIIVTLLVALVAGIVAFIATNENARNKFKEIWENITKAFTKTVDGIVNFFKVTIPKVFSTAIAWVKTNFAALLLFLINPFAGLFKYFYDNNTKFKEFVDNAIKYIKQLPSKVWTWLLNTINKVSTWATNMKEKAKTAASDFINNAISYIKQLPSKVWTWLSNVVSKVVSWGGNLASKGKQAAKKLFDSIVNKVKEIPGKIKSIGSDIVKGLWNGINNMTSWIKDKIKGFGSSVVDGLKDFFGIHSPSKLMAEEIGKWLPEGIAVGIDKNAKSTLSSMRNLVVDTVGVAKNGLTAVSTAVGGTGVGGVTNNFYQTINSPKQLSRLDIYRQSKNLLGYAGGGY